MANIFSAATRAAIAIALEADKAECLSCKEGTPVPHAAFTWVHGDKGNTYQCRSGCRWFNPETGKMEGRAHCTCDSCW